MPSATDRKKCGELWHLLWLQLYFRPNPNTDGYIPLSRPRVAPNLLTENGRSLCFRVQLTSLQHQTLETLAHTHAQMHTHTRVLLCVFCRCVREEERPEGVWWLHLSLRGCVQRRRCPAEVRLPLPGESITANTRGETDVLSIFSFVLRRRNIVSSWMFSGNKNHRQLEFCHYSH